MIVLTQSGYIKRMPLTEFEQQSRGTRGKSGAKMQNNDDLVAHFIACNAHDHVIFISDRGLAYGVRAFQVPLGSRIAKGTPLPQVRRMIVFRMAGCSSLKYMTNACS